ncbi:MAG: lysylphosphatidylglycerol synthase transmembrane domain-containing protein [Bacteroidia bacterium]
MKANLRQALQFVIFFGLGAGLMWWQYSRFTPEQREQFHFALSNADYTWFAVAMVIGALSHLSRAIRWQQLLSSLNHSTGLGNRFYAVMIGYLANYAFPRLGEVSRSGLLKSSDDVPFSEAFGTIVVERIVDLLMLGLVFVLVLLVQLRELSALWTEYIWEPAMIKLSGITANKPLFFGLVIGGVLLIAALYVFRKKIGALITGKIGNFLNGIKDGILSIRKVPNPGYFVFHSLFIWAGYLFSLYACFYCFPETKGLSINTALILLLFGTFGVIFTPGGIGAYQLIVTALMIRLVPETEPAAAPFSWLCWGSQVATVVLFAGISFAIRPLLNQFKK